MKTKLETIKVPTAIGPYSRKTAGLNPVFVSDQLPIDLETGTMPKGIKKQTEQILKNLKYVLYNGAGIDKVYQATVFLSNMSNLGPMNRTYEVPFNGDISLARSTVEFSGLPKDALAEIEAVVWKSRTFKNRRRK